MKKKSIVIAVEVTSRTSTETFKYFYKHGCRAAFIRAYSEAGIDKNLVETLRNATSAGLRVELFMDVVAMTDNETTYPLQELIDYMKRNKMILQSVWITVSSPSKWPSDPEVCKKFILSAFLASLEHNIDLGVFTSSDDWARITGGWQNWKEISSTAMLWYHTNIADGPKSVAGTSFDDFQPFPFSEFVFPVAKQFARGIEVLEDKVNYSIFVPETRAAKASAPLPVFKRMAPRSFLRTAAPADEQAGGDDEGVEQTLFVGGNVAKEAVGHEGEEDDDEEGDDLSEKVKSLLSFD